MEPEKKSNGALIGSIIIIIILIIGGIYIWQTKNENALKQKAEMDSLIQMQANELDALQQDIDTTNVNVEVDANNIN